MIAFWQKQFEEKEFTMNYRWRTVYHDREVKG